MLLLPRRMRSPGDEQMKGAISVDNQPTCFIITGRLSEIFSQSGQRSATVHANAQQTPWS